MAKERFLTAYTCEGAGFPDVQEFYLRVNFGEAGRESAHYLVGNLFALEEWERIEPELGDFSDTKVRIIGKFATLSEMRGAYLDSKHQSKELESQMHERLDGEEVTNAPPDALEAYVSNHPNLCLMISALHKVSVDRLTTLAVGLGADQRIIGQARKLAVAEFEDPNSEFLEQVIESGKYIQDKTLWDLFVAEDAPDMIQRLIEMFERCCEWPYTFYCDPEDELYPNEFHLPRRKVSRETTKNRLQEIMALVDKYETSGLIDPGVLAKARRVISLQ